MIRGEERRGQERIRFSWPFWFGYDDNGQLFRGQSIDLSKSHVSFRVEQSQCPCVGQHILTRFSFPQSVSNKFEIDSYYHWSEVIRVEPDVGNCSRIALRLHQPIEYDPSGAVLEQAVVQTA